ncbi:MAG: glycerol-3-phosphate dehydrogenase subunit GlpB [Bacteroidales bacterium]|jgi:glycerol-3-phosphate dehydrogenase subunit B|nr:glycerol-3-phosphate dehydrogenase subunit GlpB [Bacteroidales bacterium]
MKFDTIIIGGGLSGLVCGIKLQENGQNTAIVSTGQSALHFSSGAFDLLNKLDDGTEVDIPANFISLLPSSHPYSKIGYDKFVKYCREVPSLFKNASINLKGDPETNGYRITPLGQVKKTWLVFEDFNTMNTAVINYENVALCNFNGFLDFYPQFIGDVLAGEKCKYKRVTLDLPFIEKLRHNPTEMRATNIAKVFDSEENIEALLKEINSRCEFASTIMLPAVFGLYSLAPVEYLKEKCGKKICLLATMPPSVPGIRTQQMLRKYYSYCGGAYMMGDTVEKADMDSDSVKSVYTANHDGIPLSADNYVLATGSFFSNGIIAEPEGIFEPVFDLDTDNDPDRSNWYDNDFFSRQPYMKYGVKTDHDFKPFRKGRILENMYAAGSVLSGFDAVSEGCGGGVSIFTALCVANKILGGE